MDLQPGRHSPFNPETLRNQGTQSWKNLSVQDIGQPHAVTINLLTQSNARCRGGAAYLVSPGPEVLRGDVERAVLHALRVGEAADAAADRQRHKHALRRPPQHLGDRPAGELFLVPAEVRVSTVIALRTWS